MATRESGESLIRECMRSAVRLAFLRHDIELDVDQEEEEIAEDAAGACFGENTEVGKPIP